MSSPRLHPFDSTAFAFGILTYPSTFQRGLFYFYQVGIPGTLSGLLLVGLIFSFSLGTTDQWVFVPTFASLLIASLFGMWRILWSKSYAYTVSKQDARRRWARMVAVLASLTLWVVSVQGCFLAVSGQTPLPLYALAMLLCIYTATTMTLQNRGRCVLKALDADQPASVPVYLQRHQIKSSFLSQEEAVALLVRMIAQRNAHRFLAFYWTRAVHAYLKYGDDRPPIFRNRVVRYFFPPWKAQRRAQDLLPAQTLQMLLKRAPRCLEAIYDIEKMYSAEIPVESFHAWVERRTGTPLTYHEIILLHQTS